MSDDNFPIEISVSLEDAPAVAHLFQFLRNDCLINGSRDMAAHFDEIYQKVVAVIPEAAQFFDRYQWFELVTAVKNTNERSLSLADARHD